MALHGTIVEVDGSKPGFEYRSPHFQRNEITRMIWVISSYRVTGMRSAALRDAIGKTATLSDGIIDCYLGDGARLTAELPERGETRAEIVETLAVPCPKVRSGTTVKWDQGWKKYSKKERAWIAA